MKKIILLVLLALISVSASARKSYINVYAPIKTDNYIRISGDYPSGINYYCTDGVYAEYYGYIGDLLNQFSEYGFEVEFMSTADGDRMNYLLSKEIPDGQTISKGDVNEDSEVNIADVNEVISLILGIVREHPEILEQIKKQTNH